MAGGQRYVAHDGALVAERYTPAVISAVKLAPKAPETSLDDQTGELRQLLKLETVFSRSIFFQ